MGATASQVKTRPRLLERKPKKKSHVLKDLLSGWSTRDLTLLLEHYERANQLKSLQFDADCARPPVKTVSQDLGSLFDRQDFFDCCLHYKGLAIHVNRAILCIRSPFFREVVGKSNDIDLNLNLDLPAQTLKDIVRYLYTGHLVLPPAMLLKLSERFGVPNALERDLRHLLETGLFSDTTLVWTQNHEIEANKVTHKCVACSDQSEYAVHSAVLAARSPFFNKILRKRQPRVLLDEKVIPRRFARVILHCIYGVDVGQVLPHCVCQCLQFYSFDLNCSTNTLTDKTMTDKASSSCSSSLTTTIDRDLLLKQVLELFEIACFLELDCLRVFCEDFVVENLSPDNAVSVLKWSVSQSDFIQRQSLNFIRQDFVSVKLLDLAPQDLQRVLDSDYVQASELEILSSVIRWGEHQLKEEPNVIDRDAQLKQVLAPIMPLVRIGHVIPVDHDVIISAAKRGLVSQLPLETHIVPFARGITSWLKQKPRLFSPFVEEARACLQERLRRPIEAFKLQTDLYCACPPPSTHLIDDSHMFEMKQREIELRPELSCCQVQLLIQLRVIREFGFPDDALMELHKNEDVYGMAPSSGVLSNLGSNGANEAPPLPPRQEFFECVMPDMVPPPRPPRGSHH